MNRDIKFRAWDTYGEWPYMLGPYKLSDAIFNHKDIIAANAIHRLHHDKNESEIYEGEEEHYPEVLTTEYIKESVIRCNVCSKRLCGVTRKYREENIQSKSLCGSF